MDYPLDALPDFQHPPVTEVAMGVQFEPLANLRSAHLGLLWQKFPDLPNIEEQPHLAHVKELFGATSDSASFEIVGELPMPRTLFVNGDETELVQVQQDRFFRNWRKRTDKAVYPRYEDVKKKFCDSWSIFDQFLKEQNLGKPVIDQCELTYVNHLRAQGDLIPQNPEKFISFLDSGLNFFLPQPESVKWFASYEIIEPDCVGRLHVSSTPAILRENMEPIIRLALTARGCPEEITSESILRYFDVYRNWIVKGFVAVTTPEMHKKWGLSWKH